MTTDKKLGCLIGLAVGDALGAPYEFMSKNQYTVSGKFEEGGAHDVAIGEYTDDTSMALCLAQSLIDKKTFDPYDQMNKYVDWFFDGYMSSRGECFDIGSTTAAALRNYTWDNRKNPYTTTGGKESDGNAPIMRLAPIPIFFDDMNKVMQYSRLSSKTTHRSELCADVSVVFGAMLKHIINGRKKTDIEDGIAYTTLDPRVKRAVDRAKEDELQTFPTGFIINTFEVALWGFFHYDNFIDGLKFVISLGYDTDTVGAIYGQLAGAYYGIDGIPDYYKENLMDYDKIYNIGVDLINLSDLKRHLKDIKDEFPGFYNFCTTITELEDGIYTSIDTDQVCTVQYHVYCKVKNNKIVALGEERHRDGGWYWIETSKLNSIKVSKNES